jgi:hypothetical protein
MTSDNENFMRIIKQLTLATVAALVANTASAKELLWGDTHLHTSYSFDAYTNGNRSADPATAYRYAMGEPVIHPFHRARVQIHTPLDFLVVSDHAEFLGVIKHIYEEGGSNVSLGWSDWLGAEITAWLLRRSVANDTSLKFFGALLPEHSDARDTAKLMEGKGYDSGSLMPDMPAVRSTAWDSISATADRYNNPGEFTALIGWEWTSTPGGANLHRVVVTDAKAEQASKIMPFSFNDSPFPEDLWQFLEGAERDTGARFVSIPHNSNLSKGWMFDTTSLRGAPIDVEYAKTRARWEPIAEITQIKGDSETHPDLSPNDVFADYEEYPHYLAKIGDLEYKATEGDYLRSALKRGLAIGAEVGVNPYRLGFIGSTDSHTGLSSAEEDNFHGKMALDSVPERKQAMWGDDAGPTGWSMSAAGLAAVWAESNTREAIIDAFKRKEVYGSTGPRIALQVYALSENMDLDVSRASATAKLAVEGMPMGAAISGDGRERFRLAIFASQDPKDAALQRLQVVKGWIDAEGETHEQVYDALVSEKSGGASHLNAVWQDPDFDESQTSFYYARVLQVPTVRHSSLDARALQIVDTGHPDAIQERAYSSPIWYR